MSGGQDWASEQLSTSGGPRWDDATLTPTLPTSEPSTVESVGSSVREQDSDSRLLSEITMAKRWPATRPPEAAG